MVIIGALRARRSARSQRSRRLKMPVVRVARRCQNAAPPPLGAMSGMDVPTGRRVGQAAVVVSLKFIVNDHRRLMLNAARIAQSWANFCPREHDARTPGTTAAPQYTGPSSFLLCRI